jgi:hypothetical protein
LKANHDKEFGNHSLFGMTSGQESSKILNTVADFDTTKKYPKTSWEDSPLTEDEKMEMKEEFATFVSMATHVPCKIDKSNNGTSS